MALGKGLPKNAYIQGNNTRFAHINSLPYHRTKLIEKKTTHIGAKFFNALPVELKKSTEPVKLMNPLKMWLSAQPFYTVAEFFNLRD